MALTQISTAGVKDDAVTAGKIPANAVGSSELADNAVDTNAIQDDAVTTAKIAAGNITATELGTDSVTGAKIAAGAINNANKIQDSIITGAKVGSGTIVAGNIASNAVTTAKIADDAVTNAKIGSQAVGQGELANNAVGTAQIGDGTVTAAKLGSGVQTTINNNADNRVITGSGTANTLNGEANVNIDSSGRLLIATNTASGASTNADDLKVGSESSGSQRGLTIGSAVACNIRFADADDTAGAIIYYHSDNTMRFTAGSSEKMRILSGGGLTFHGDTAAANALDDYEEGTWTPSSHGFTIGTTYSARYTKIGRMIHVSCYIMAATGSGTSQQPIILGLPYTATAASNTYSYGAGRIGNGASSGLSGNDIVFQINYNTTQAKIYVADGGINESMISGQHLIFSAVYETTS